MAVERSEDFDLKVKKLVDIRRIKKAYVMH